MVSVLIPTTTGGCQHLVSLMPGLSQEPGAEVIVVDNNSRDQSGLYLSAFDCTVIHSRENLGFARANNRAAGIAKGEYLLLLNNDTTVSPGFLAEMLRVFSLRENIGIVGCLIYTQNLPRRVSHAGIRFTEGFVPYEVGLPVPGITEGIEKSDPTVYEVREVPAVTGACLMVKRSVWDEVGGLDEGYANGWEDNDFCLKVREKGYTVWYTGKTYITHKKFGSGGRLRFEAQNRKRYDDIWVTSGRARRVLERIPA